MSDTPRQVDQSCVYLLLPNGTYDFTISDGETTLTYHAVVDGEDLEVEPEPLTVPVTPGVPVVFDTAAEASNALGRAELTPSAEIAAMFGGDAGRIEFGDYFVERTIVFPAPTDATNEMSKAIRKEAVHLFKQGCRYRKSGVIFFGLEKLGAAYQPELFSGNYSPFPIPHSPSKLYQAINALNAKLGKGKVFSPAEGVGTPAWRMKLSKLSKRATTNWDELLTVR